MDQINAKPSGLTSEYGGQFQDATIVHAYQFREPYAEEAFDFLSKLTGTTKPRILDLGCGTGDLTLGLSPFADCIDAVDPSKEMIANAKSRSTNIQNINWILSDAESTPLNQKYDLVTAAQSLHWMDWPKVFKILKTVLKPGKFLAIVERSYVHTDWWNDDFQAIIDTYSTNKDFVKYNLIEELEHRKFFKTVGTHKAEAIPFRQKVDELIKAFHSRNGFSRDRMTLEAATAFDNEARKHLSSFASNNNLDLGARTRITWGQVL